MQRPFLSIHSRVGDAGRQRAIDERSMAFHNIRKLPPPATPNAALSGFLMGFLGAVTAFVALLLAGRPVVEGVLVANGVLSLVLLKTIILTRREARNAEPTAVDDRQPEIVDIWRTYPGGDEGGNPLRIALIAPDGAQTRKIATDLAELGPQVHHSSDRAAMLDSITARPEKWGAVLLDLDAVPDRAAGRDDLRDFRAACPDVQVLLLSGGSRHGDGSP